MHEDSAATCSCPYLPEVEELLDYKVTRRHGDDKGPDFYHDALRFSQSLWQQGKPAQAILQIDKAFMADIRDGGWLAEDMDPGRVGGIDPYGAMIWMLKELGQGAEGFGGNPVRHFQHLASRMSGPRPEPRRWRAWVCLHLAEKVLPLAGFERDGIQIAREGLWIPGIQRSLAGLVHHGWVGEAAHVEKCLKS